MELKAKFTYFFRVYIATIKDVFNMYFDIETSAQILAFMTIALGLAGTVLSIITFALWLWLNLVGA